MPKPFSGHDLSRLAPNLRGWGNTEFQLRHLMSEAQRGAEWSLFERLSIRSLTCALYRLRGFSVDAEGLCPVYDLLRHGKPMDFDLLHEARYTQAVLRRYYAQGQPVTRKSVDAWLRAMIELANTVGTYEANTEGPDSWRDSGPLFTKSTGPSRSQSPFVIPPGPFEALRSVILDTMTSHPPLLAALALLNDLHAHDALFPHSIDLAALLLAPGLLSLGLGYAPLAICVVAPEDEWASLAGLERATCALRGQLDKTSHTLARLHDRAKLSRRGGHMSAALEAIMAEPVFTAQSLAKMIGCVPRTTEKLVTRLSHAAVISSFQQQGRLTIWKQA